jgi:hypothetical protein
MAINVVLETDDLTVLGPPASIDLQVDIGPKGEQGSFIYSASGDPNSVVGPFISRPARIGDLYFRIDNNAFYQFVSVPGGTQWQIISNIRPLIYNTLENINFSSGSGSTSLLLNNFFSNAPANLTPEQLSVQLTAEGENPVAITLKSKGITSGSTRSLLLEFVAAEYESGSWQSMSGSANIAVTINVV